MIEIVFSSSAAGSLKQASFYGKGRFNEDSVGLIMGSGGGDAESVHAARRMAMERARERWEKAVPLDVDRKDVYCLNLALDLGSISEDIPGIERERVFAQAEAVFPGTEMKEHARKVVADSAAALEEILERTGAGESVRVWYSSHPDELCGMHWFMARLGENCGEINIVKLPEWEYTAEGNIEIKRGWGEVSPGEWGRYAALTQKVDQIFRRKCAYAWKKLKRENTPMRAAVNGQLLSVDEGFYDGFIRREIAGARESFRETDIIISLLQRNIGIGDVWIDLRIEEMLKRGELTVLEAAPEDHPRYRRVLRKVGEA